jgi:hypothetical protein
MAAVLDPNFSEYRLTNSADPRARICLSDNPIRPSDPLCPIKTLAINNARIIAQELTPPIIGPNPPSWGDF